MRPRKLPLAKSFGDTHQQIRRQKEPQIFFLRFFPFSASYRVKRRESGNADATVATGLQTTTEPQVTFYPHLASRAVSGRKKSAKLSNRLLTSVCHRPDSCSQQFEPTMQSAHSARSKALTLSWISSRIARTCSIGCPFGSGISQSTRFNPGT